MTEHYTHLLQEVLNAAKELAIQKHNYQVDIPHVWTVLTQPQAFALEFYTGLDLDINEFISVINQELAKIPVFSHTDTNRYGRQYSQRLKNLLDDAEAERAELRDEVVTVEHLILSLFHQQRNPITVFLKQAGIDKELVAAKLNKFRQGKRAISPSQESRYQALSKYATNFNQWLADKTDRQVIGRKDEIDDIIRVLCRKEKSNAILLGFPGVGKSKVIEGFVGRLLADDVPEHLLGKEVFKLNLGGLIAGTKYRGEFEERFKAVLDEVLAAKGKIILYIEDIHQIVTAGRTEGSLDAGNLLKPILAQGQINIIGTTTFAAYRESFELDQALEGRFQRIRIEEPDQDKALTILQGLRENYQDFHGVRLTDEALQAAISLSIRYLSDRYLPDKALDLIDEACAVKKIQLGQAQTERPDVSREDIASIVERITGIKVQGIMDNEREHLLNLDKLLRQRIVGQDQAVRKVSEAILRSRAGIQNPKRPIGSFLFLGPTGVGKTALAKSLAERLFGNELEMVRLDMSEYMEKHAVARLVGPPPGYVGFEEGGQLTEAVRRRLYSIVLLDEIEKAHPDVFNSLLQVLDEGRLTDSKGRTIDFKNTILIMTSNIGSQQILESLKSKQGLTSETQDEVLALLQHSFRPEFLNRIDETVIFNPLRSEDMVNIVKIMVRQLQERLKQQKIQLHLSEEVYAFLAQKGYQPEFGARPIQRSILRYLETPLARYLVENKETTEMTVHVSLKDGQLDFNYLV
ncbi:MULTISPECIES: ATP-dependent Clp protease ATP-binding subunit [Streptococcus]|jgi:ATPases with chaperone activity, ATP-binding subunit, putative|uniref:ATP-dependent Clp protease ATP-binding subunit n=1 Tax=Streptococcus TaxID=1301 RepID=UPI000F6715BC|nr:MULTISPECIES: ATP-dependent Clp protease ATP-binding subunit [Streptococcus]MBZ2026531.1 ATP-dependent Clp protease ATP-binding subunit [Streptococcus sanguinis]RSI03094.1 Negative regulator of genetic competence ClpC/MecB [Streptococcus sanguinis]RSI41145.1 Negative regulator of genetic competence ClpC/MecB [Streptococcus sanguinis]WNU93650.1 ATP-dependent Clp protease ATP-binding subunit [Streptococcus sp. DTU_2020_1000888_1_SI_GRL_NUU_041A]